MVAFLHSKTDRAYWIALGTLCIGLVAVEVIVGDVLINSKTQTMSSVTKVSIVLISGGMLALFLTGALRKFLLSPTPEVADEDL